jgi:hypothetical protein
MFMQSAIPDQSQMQNAKACLSVGKEVVARGLIMDNFCITKGTLVDAPTVKTLENPQIHSIHCLIDVPDCIKSKFTILAPPAKAGGLYSVKYQLDIESSAIALKEAEKLRTKGLKMSGFSMEFKGIDDGTGILKCATPTGFSAAEAGIAKMSM